jgi:predicted DCC family thiol-disulfide oxidoreductase YuxK
MPHEAPVVVFDGDCEFCKGAVAFIRRHDRKGRFRYVAFGSPEAARLLADNGSACDTLHFFDGAGHHQRSTAVLRIAMGLGLPWSLFRILMIVPPRLRDTAYDFIARRRRALL